MADCTGMCRVLAGCWAVAVAIAVAPAAAAEPSDSGSTEVRSGGPVPTVNGVPCVAGHLGTCLGFLQNHPPAANPVVHSDVGHSPTVRR
jgi:hypothetical protein